MLKCQKKYLYIFLLIIDPVCLLSIEMFEIYYIMHINQTLSIRPNYSIKKFQACAYILTAAG